MAHLVIKRDFTNQVHFHCQTFHVVGRILRVSGSAVKKPFLDLPPEIVDKLSLIREADTFGRGRKRGNRKQMPAAMVDLDP